MKRFLPQTLLVAAALFTFNVSAQAAETYHFDSMHTYVLWHISHFGFSVQAGKFTMIDGTLTLDETAPQNSKVNVTVHTENLATGIPKLDEHLKTPMFFDTAKYPTATFVSSKIEVTGQNTGKIYGTLTLHGVSKPVVLDAVMLKQGVSPITNKNTIGFSATTKIKRSDFGMNAYLPNLGDEVQIDIGAEANQPSK
jgi:polyisoprenoid-binding protein YceI